MPITISIRIHGKVQGIFFRAFAKKTADRLGIKGRVRNVSDGSVYIEASGEEDALHAFLHILRHEHAHAKVDRMDIEESTVKDFSGFEVE